MHSSIFPSQPYPLDSEVTAIQAFNQKTIKAPAIKIYEREFSKSTIYI